MTEDTVIQCPIHGCKIEKSVADVESHVIGHNLYELEHALKQFIDTEEYWEYSTRDQLEAQFGDGDLFNRNWDRVDRIKLSLTNHPIFSVQMYNEIVGPIEDTAFSKSTVRDSECDLDIVERVSVRQQLRSIERQKEHIVHIDGPNINRYGWEYIDSRGRVLRRDDFQCRICGADALENPHSCDVDLDVHHITPASVFLEADGPTDFEAMNDPSNLITLCPSCHGKYEGDHQGADPAEFVELVESE